MSLVSRGIFLVFIALLLTMSGCNMYEFSAGDDSTRDIIEEGKQDMRDGNYQAAFEKFDKALLGDPLNSELLYLRAKAAIRRTGTNTLEIMTALQSTDPQSPSGASLPFMNEDEWSDGRADSLYQGIQIVVDDLGKIFRNEADLGIDSADIELDLMAGYAIWGLLSFRDTNRDKVIDGSDFKLNVFFQNGQLLFKDFLPDTANLPSSRHNPFKGGESRIAEGGLEGLTSDNINDLIDIVIFVIDNARDILIGFIAQQAETGLENDALDDVLDVIRNEIQKYYSGDGIDNDGDRRIDEEILNGVDDDNDGRIDEDSQQKD